jgi:hypothetical protein
MANRHPGVSRESRIGATGLERLERHLQGGAKIGRAVLTQWIRRYGEPARALIKRYGQYEEDLEP